MKGRKYDMESATRTKGRRKTRGRAKDGSDRRAKSRKTGGLFVLPIKSSWRDKSKSGGPGPGHGLVLVDEYVCGTCLCGLGLITLTWLA
jgi:hypothetical protein